jgi:hypothetical protein
MHKRLLLSFPTLESSFTHVDVEIYYNKGGMNYFTGSVERRGYYLSIQPLTKYNNGYSYTAFTGVKQLIREAGRFSSKVLAEFIIDYDMMNTMIEHIVEKHNIKLDLPNKEGFINYQLLSNVIGMQTDTNSHTEQIKL